MSPPRSSRLLGLACLLLASGPALLADPRVAVISTASPDYFERKFGHGGKPRLETYVFMQGNYFEGRTVDRSIEKMPFRRIADYLAPELAKQEYLPTTRIGEADLLLVVHWGTTNPHVSSQEMMGRTTSVTDMSTDVDSLNRSIRQEAALGDPSTSEDDDTLTLALLDIGNPMDARLNLDRLEQLNDQIAGDMSRASNMALLGYADQMYKFKHSLWVSPFESTLRYDLSDERYFIIVQAYDLKVKPEAGRSRRPLWKMHLNISSPGNNFSTALSRMSLVAGNFAGRTSGEVVSVRAGRRTGTVTYGPMIILGEVK